MKQVTKLDLIAERAQRNYESHTDTHQKLEWAYVRDTIKQYQIENTEPYWIEHVDKWVQAVCICILCSGYIFKNGLRGSTGTYARAMKDAVLHFGTLLSILSGKTRIVRKYDSKTMQIYEDDIEK